MRKKRLFTACLVLTALLLSACGCEQTKSSMESNALTVDSTQNRDVLFGTWTVDGYTSYYFDGQGQGNMLLPDDSFNFSYMIQGDLLEIDFEDNTATDAKYQFTVKNDKLTLVGKKANDGTHELIKTD